MKQARVTYTAEFFDIIEVPDDWEYDGNIESLLEFTDLPYRDGDLLDWDVEA